jgi:4,5-DOPA dioxygenase extradiol
MSDKQYSRRTILAGLLGAAAGAAGCSGSAPQRVENVMNDWSAMPDGELMPAVFDGHGTPLSAIQPNQWTETWARVGSELPRPKAILMISAHWLTRGGALITASEWPRMNYDFGYTLPELLAIQYPAPGEPALAREVTSTLSGSLPVYGDSEWGFDHATWVVLKYMFPKADIPVIQLSIDYSQPPQFHYDLARRLQGLRTKGVMIMGSGNIVHNLMRREPDNKPYDWALEFDSTIAKHIADGNHQAVTNFLNLGSMASLSQPTHDHFLPLLYCLGVKTGNDSVTAFNDSFQWSAVTMRSYVISPETTL